MAKRPHRILVVDDNENNRDILARRLGSRGYEVEVAVDGFQALEMIGDGVYDLIILDIMMPGMSGLEVLEKLRQRFSRAELPILMATAKSDSRDMVDALQLGANDYVTKPIDFPVVFARIQNHLQTRQLAPSLPAPAALLPADGRAEPGTVLDGRYEVQRTLGEGAFAMVFLAKQLSTGQLVAVKVLRFQRAHATQQKRERRRFEREMKVIGELRHPNVVRLIDFGELKARVREAKGWATDGGEVLEETTETRVVVKRLPYIVMEYVEGQTLQAYLNEHGALELEKALAMLLPVVSAVATAHRAGVVHRDLKPPNILLGSAIDSKMHPQVLDFGIAKPLEGEEGSMSSNPEALGTPEYMAPESLIGAEADRATDQYALGVIAYEALSGVRPFHGNTFVALLQAVSAGDRVPLGQRRDALPEGLVAVVERAMARDPKERFSDLDAFGRALLPFASDALRARWSDSFGHGALDISMPAPPLEGRRPESPKEPEAPKVEAPPVQREAEAEFTATAKVNETLVAAAAPPNPVLRYAWWVLGGGVALCVAAAAAWFLR